MAAHTCAQQTSWLAATQPTLPPARYLHAMAQDPGRDRVVMFGGQDLATLGDTWEWDGADWARATTASPPPRTKHAMAYCSGSAQIVMFGGQGRTWPPLADTWEWDGRVWTQRTPAISPAARGGHAMAPHYNNRTALLFGGSGTAASLDDTWEWGGLSWQQRTPATRPEGRAYHAMAYDPHRARVVLFGGLDQGGGLIVNDTWEWDGNTWTRFPASSTSPEARTSPAMASDPVARRVVMHGGLGVNQRVLGDTYTWDGATWVAQTPGPAHWGSALAPDYQRRLVRFGGHDLTTWNLETWLYGVLIPAASHPFGIGCASASPPVLASQRPYLGNPIFELTLRQALPSVACVFALAPNAGALSFGACTLYLRGPLATVGASTDSSGVAYIRIQTLMQPWLRGQLLYAQAFALDATSAPLGAAFSGALALRLGD